MLNKLTKKHIIGLVVGCTLIKSLIFNELQRFELQLKKSLQINLVVVEIFWKPHKHWGFRRYNLQPPLYVFALNEN